MRLCHLLVFGLLSSFSASSFAVQMGGTTSLPHPSATSDTNSQNQRGAVPRSRDSFPPHGNPATSPVGNNIASPGKKMLPNENEPTPPNQSTVIGNTPSTPSDRTTAPQSNDFNANNLAQ